MIVDFFLFTIPVDNCNYFNIFAFTSQKSQITAMEESSNRNNVDVYTNIIKAGKRTYFFDVKLTKSGEKYLTITESKRRYDEEQDKFIYEKHKIFLYREDFENFIQGLSGAIAFIDTDGKGLDSELSAAEANNIPDLSAEDFGL